MGFFSKIREKIAHFMSGRYGSDQLNMTLVVVALIVTVIGSFTSWRIPFMIVADAILVVVFIRMLGKDRYKRAHENEVYLTKTMGVRRAVSEWINRVKNSKKYHYYICPKCKARLRVPRGIGQVTITCKKCGEKFDRKA